MSRVSRVLRRLRPAWQVCAPLLLGTGLQFAAALAPGAVERGYAETVFPAVSRLLGLATDWCPWSVAELLLPAVAFAPLLWLLRRPPWRAVLRAGVAGAGLLYLAFLLLWGLNYHRQPLAVQLGLDVVPVAAAQLETLCNTLVSQADELRAPLPQDASGVLHVDLGATLSRTRLGPAAAAHELRSFRAGARDPKPLLLSRAFSHLGIAGIYAPFTGEANVNVEVPAPDLPFAASHELAHQCGIAREDEANYAGWLACRRHPDPEFRYSGTLAASSYTLQALAAVAPTAARRIAALRSPAVKRDIQAVRSWAARYQGPARALSHAVNDAYLKANLQRDGVQSYGRMVDLLLAEARRGPLR